MIAAKQFKKMDGDEMLKIFDVADISGDDAKLACVIEDKPESHFEICVARGIMRASDIVFSMQPLYRIYWQVVAGKNFHVCASLALASPGDPSVWGSGVEKLARENNCSAITFQTARRGHISDALVWGATVTGVTMKKVL